MAHFTIELTEKGQNGLPRETAKSMLREMGKRLNVPLDQFVLSGVRESGTYYVVFYVANHRAFFMKVLKNATVPFRLIEGAPPGTEVPPSPKASTPPPRSAEGFIKAYNDAVDAVGKLFGGKW